MTGLKPTGAGTTDVDLTLTIVITCYNTREIVRDCLQSIYQNPPSDPYEIVLVDDASSDGTSEMARTAFPEVHLLRNDVNLNYALANNRGNDAARGRYILLLNNDTIVLPNALDGMIEFLRAHPEAGAVGCRLLNEDGTTQWSAKARLGPSAAIFGSRSPVTKLFPNNPFSRRELLHRDSGEPFVVGYVSGAASMTPSKVMREVGPLDPSFWHHVDADFCKRASDLGYKCYYLPSVSIVHLNHKGGSTATMRARFRHLLTFEVCSYRYYRKHILRSPWNPMSAVVAFGLTLHFLISFAFQVCAEFIDSARSALQPKRSAEGDPRNSTLQ